MINKLFYAGQELVLSDAISNKNIVDQLKSGVFPGVVTLQGSRTDYVVNLSEGVPFAFSGDLAAE